KNISIHYIFEGQIDDEEKELVSVKETEKKADFDEDFTVDTTVKRLDPPQPIKNKNGLLIYIRKE
ncbi:hypothetical protein, partial [Klebsiella pneumoniae]|uniref:hypothetical protein n=1 Tax=Klebsiella pneumoniae TaxID=573 RepID=UPI0013D26E20